MMMMKISNSAYGIITLVAKSCHICTGSASGTLADCGVIYVGQKKCGQHEGMGNWKLSDSPLREGMEIWGLVWITF